MPKSVGVLLLLVICAIAISPMAIAPGIAESHGYGRSTGSILGAFVSMAMFGVLGWASMQIIRRRQNRERQEAINKLINTYRDDGKAGEE